MTGDTWFLYRIECRTPDHFYIGVTTQPIHRKTKHEQGAGAQFTQCHGVKDFVILAAYDSKAEALSAEHRTVVEIRDKGFTVAGSGWTQTHWPRVRAEGPRTR